MSVLTIAIGLLAVVAAPAATPGRAPWIPDQGDGTYVNPIVFADYPDPDVIRVGDDFYLAASSFSSVPGLPILQSKDLVNWTIIGHAATRLASPDFDTPQHGKGLWAPSLRHHRGRFWIYVGDPDRGIYVTTARDPRGPWSPLTIVKEAKGAIDLCPLWDGGGKVYLVHAWAGWISLSARSGWLRLYAEPRPESVKSVFDLPNVLMQKTPAEEFAASARIDASALGIGERAGLVVMGRDTAFIAVQRNAHGLMVVRSAGKGVDAGGRDEESPSAVELKDVLPAGVVILRAWFEKGGRVRFHAHSDEMKLVDLESVFVARQGVWVGARVGLFTSSPAETTHPGRADFDWFRIERSH
jgi:beta-xylosidase